MAYYDDSPKYRCKACQNLLADRRDLISKNYHTKSGPGYLFSHVTNVIEGAKEDRQLITGLYTIADIYCFNCRTVLGWKYVRAYELNEKFKEGKFVVERQKLNKAY